MSKRIAPTDRIDVDGDVWIENAAREYVDSIAGTSTSQMMGNLSYDELDTVSKTKIKRQIARFMKPVLQGMYDDILGRMTDERFDKIVNGLDFNFEMDGHQTGMTILPGKDID